MVGNLNPFLCLLWPACWLGGCQLAPRGSPKGSKKDPKNEPKLIRNPPGRPLACPRVSGGTPQVPPRLPTCIFMHIYAYFAHIYAYSYIFCQYLCVFMHVFVSFMHIHAHCCTRHPYLCIFYVYLYIFSITKQLTTQIPTNQWTFGCWTGVTPWHGGGLGAVRL